MILPKKSPLHGDLARPVAVISTFPVPSLVQHIDTYPFGRKSDIQYMLWTVTKLNSGAFRGSYQPVKEPLDVSDAASKII